MIPIHRGRAETAYRQPCPSCSRQHFWVNVFCLTNLRPSSKQNRGQIHSLKNVVCYRKDKAAGTQFLPSPCEFILISSQQTWSGFSPTRVPDNNRQSGFSPTTVPKLSTGSEYYCTGLREFGSQEMLPIMFEIHTLNDIVSSSPSKAINLLLFSCPYFRTLLHYSLNKTLPFHKFHLLNLWRKGLFTGSPWDVSYLFWTSDSA